MKFGFVTCVQLGLTCMEAIYEAGGALDLVLTLPDATAVAKSGRIYVWEVLTGQLLGEVEGAHYLDITDMDIAVTNDLVITGGKDFKVKVWILTE